MALRTPPLHAVHETRGASFTDFGGWEMPVEFDSINEEHEAVRTAAGIFDVSHMGEITVTGPDATELMNRLTTNDVAALEPGEAQYAAITDEEGIIIDDTVVYRLPDSLPEGTPGAGADYLFIPNAGHDAQMHERWTAHREQWDLDADVTNQTDEYGIVAVQGPDAEDLVAAAAGEAARDLGRFSAEAMTIAEVPAWVARTGYTGEDGYEIVVPMDEMEPVWAAFDCQPCGLGARDTLRLEYGLLLSGQDFNPEENPRTPLEAGIGFAVDLDTDFVGRDALAAQQESGVEQVFTGFVLEERGVPRHGYSITDEDGAEIGAVTSGTMSPTLREPIGLGYVDEGRAEDGETVFISIRDEGKRAVVRTPPFIGENQ
ncbi:glycine cleavage system protein T [Halodesulfurarchaeum formicicum]|uniref:Probable aminomethyltransferase n=1 Tax=Halodesulfurarchaeum formicicum TaxID=1873524 RepID=A0A1D8S2W5_9EURY|nr:glycine cleavage system aminomethyltransferase GcvT [Halodesulfurarchaeum formicicum]AOW79700.1 glycine cleavage system protein T [Halodesulfurarchaeum formicicum]APE94950.1 glycine cleavage system protein T [Halodesulfurarchaeum formicicum]